MVCFDSSVKCGSSWKILFEIFFCNELSEGLLLCLASSGNDTEGFRLRAHKDEMVFYPNAVQSSGEHTTFSDFPQAEDGVGVARCDGYVTIMRNISSGGFLRAAVRCVGTGPEDFLPVTKELFGGKVVK